MRSRTEEYDVQNSAYMLEYGRRRILNCADTFENLAAAFCEMNREEAEDGGESAGREHVLRRKRTRDTRESYAYHLRQLAGMMEDVAKTRVQFIRLGGKKEKLITRALAGEDIMLQDIFLLRGEENRLEVSVCVSTRKDTSVTAEDIAGYLSVLMDLRLMSQKRNPYFIGAEPV